MNAESAGDFQVSHFSTAAYRPHERITAWREVFGRTVVHIDIAPHSAESFGASATLTRSSTFGLIDATTSPVSQANSKSLIVSDDVSFGSVTTTRWSASQLGRTLDLQPGDGVLLSNSDIGGITFPKCCYRAFSVPRSAIAPRVSDIGALFAQRIPASSPALQMLFRYLDIVRGDNVVTTPALAAAFTDHICDLLVLALGPTRDAAQLARTRGLPAARLQAMKDDIRKNLGCLHLTVHAIAARHKVSVRYVQRLFEESSCTLTQFIMEQRLTAAHNALIVRSSVPIHTIAYDLGFNDVSYFNRAFRQRFGCTPSDVRRSRCWQ